MNEQAVAVVCAILSAICTILYGYYAKQADWGSLIIGICFALIIVLLSAYTLVMRYL